METINLTKMFNDLNDLTKHQPLFLQTCMYLTEALIKQQTNIYDIVQHLETLLTTKSIDKREMGTLLLSEILERLPSDLLDSTELFFIAKFYSDRLQDHHQIIPAVLKGFAALTKMKNLPDGSSQNLLRALFESVTCQQQQKQDRLRIYEIFIELVNRKPIEIKSMGLDFVLGIIQAIDGERSPNNLLLLFKWIPKFLKTINLSHLTEEMFSVLECYFPVDFRAPSLDPQHVMRDDLADALCDCLCAIPEFGQFCIPLIIDKLNSSLVIAKLDSMQLLSESCKTFEPEIYEAHFHSLITSLQSEVLLLSEPEIEEASLSAITCLIRKLSESEQKIFFRESITNLYDTLKENFRPDTKLFTPTIKILLAVAKGSLVSCNFITDSLGLLLINQFKITKRILHKRTLLKALMEFFIVYIEMNNITDITTVEMLKEIPSICIESILHFETKMQILGYSSITKIAKTIPFNIRRTIYEILKNTIIENGPTDLRQTCLTCFKTFSAIYSKEVLDNVLSSEIDENNIIILKLYLEALCTVATEKPFAPVLLPKLINYCINYDMQTSKITFKCFKKLLEEDCDNEDLQNYLYKDCQLIKLCMEWLLDNMKNNEIDKELLEEVADIIKLIIGFQPINEQELVIKTYINESVMNYKLNGHVQQKFIIILEGLLIRLKPEVEIPDKFQFINDLVQMSACVENEIYTHACKLIANILNKSIEDENFQNTLIEIEAYLKANLENNENDLHVKNLTELLSWITKALIVKGSNLSNSWTDQLIYLLDGSKEIAKSFRLIMDDKQEWLSTKSYCINRLLYRQKFFAYVCKKLSTTYTDNKPNHLIALGYLLQLAPEQVVILYFKEMLRLLVLCLDVCTDPVVLCAVLNTLCSLIVSHGTYLEGHIDDLIPRFLRLTKFESSVTVRVASIRCLQEVAIAYPVYKLLPHKQAVTSGLLARVDDKKRLVRKEAARTRSSWFLLDSPT